MARRTFTRSRVAKRKTIWIGTANQADVALSSGGTVIVSSFAPDALGALKPTVVRTRGQFLVFPTVETTSLTFNGAYGLGVFSDDALAAGAASMPGPWDQDDWTGWLVHGYFSGRLRVGTTDVDYPVPGSVSIDSKAMRKVGPNESLVWLAESEEGAVQINIQARVLLMLS